MDKIPVRVKFLSYEWDNYQGGSGKIIEREETYLLEPVTTLEQIQSIIIEKLNFFGYKDWRIAEDYSGRGLLSINLIYNS